MAEIDAADQRRAAWRRYRRMMALVTAVALATIAAALAVLHRQGVILRPHFVVALALGIGVSLLLAGALMGLAFASAGSGHDDTVGQGDQPRRPPRPWG